MLVRHDFVGTIQKVTETPQGGIRVDARIARVGVQSYQKSDGSVFREYRPADEVFSQDALSSFAHAPVTVGHPGEVNSKNYRQHSVGHAAETPHVEDGKFVAVPLVIQDADTVEAVKRKDLCEVSCGYTCELDETPGTVDGERYDGVQRNIRGNHIALGPKGWGRAGPEVSLKMDGTYADVLHDHYTRNMDFEKLYKETLEKLQGLQARLDASEKTREDGHKAEVSAIQTKLDALEGSKAALEKQLKAEKDRADNASDPKRFDAAVEARVKLIEDAKALGWDGESKGVSNRQIREDAIKHVDTEFNATGRSDDYVTAYFDSVMARPHAKLGTERLTADAAEEADPIEKSRQRMVERNSKIHSTSKRTK